MLNSAPFNFTPQMFLALRRSARELPRTENTCSVCTQLSKQSLMKIGGHGRLRCPLALRLSRDRQCTYLPNVSCKAYAKKHHSALTPQPKLTLFYLTSGEVLRLYSGYSC
jgi:hypothetical protein